MTNAARRARILIVAAEASGDELGADLIAELRLRLGDRVEFFGVGGPAMAGQGLASAFDIGSLSVAGWFEGLAAYPLVKRRVREVVALAEDERPDAAVLIDSWGFTLRVAQGLRALSEPPAVIKYVAPQVWASRPGRAKTLAATVDHLLTLHTFDAPFFEAEGLPVTFVGQTALARDLSGADAAAFRRVVGAPEGAPALLILPGSRAGEIARMAPVFGETARRLLKGRPDLKIVVPAAATVAEQVRAAVAAWDVPAAVLEGEAGKRDAMAGATCALACSGTVTTELALAGCPFVVGYVATPLTYLAAKLILKTPWLTLLNIAAAREVAPEFIQGRCTPENLETALAPLLDDAQVLGRLAAEQAGALAVMRGPQANARAPAEIAADVVIRALHDRGAL
ncbi:lipid-A-disaccharide synthase [soil metagenome]